MSFAKTRLMTAFSSGANIKTYLKTLPLPVRSPDYRTFELKNSLILAWIILRILDCTYPPLTMHMLQNVVIF